MNLVTEDKLEEFRICLQSFLFLRKDIKNSWLLT